MIKKRWNFPCHRVRVNVVITFSVCKFPLLLCALLTAVTSLPCSFPRTLSQIARTTYDTSNQRLVVRHWTFPTFVFFNLWAIIIARSIDCRSIAERLPVDSRIESFSIFFSNLFNWRSSSSEYTTERRLERVKVYRAAAIEKKQEQKRKAATLFESKRSSKWVRIDKKAYGVEKR